MCCLCCSWRKIVKKVSHRAALVSIVNFGKNATCAQRDSLRFKAPSYVQFLLRSRWRDEYKFLVHVSLIRLIDFILFSINAATRIHILYLPYFVVLSGIRLYGKRILPKATNFAFEQRSFVWISCLEWLLLRNNFQKSPIKLNLSRKCTLFHNCNNEEISCYSLAHEE